MFKKVNYLLPIWTLIYWCQYYFFFLTMNGLRWFFEKFEAGRQQDSRCPDILDVDIVVNPSIYPYRDIRCVTPKIAFYQNPVVLMKMTVTSNVDQFSSFSFEVWERITETVNNCCCQFSYLQPGSLYFFLLHLGKQ